MSNETKSYLVDTAIRTPWNIIRRLLTFFWFISFWCSISIRLTNIPVPFLFRFILAWWPIRNTLHKKVFQIRNHIYTHDI